MTTFRLLLTADSGNTKLGRMPATYLSMDTCPTDCAFYQNGCYAAGRIFHSANMHAKQWTVEEMAEAINKRGHLTAPLIRDRVSGDVITPEGTINMAYLLAIAEVGRLTEKTPFGYTHAWRRFRTDQVQTLAANGYIMNASCETEGQISDAIDRGFPVTTANPSLAEGQMINGRRVVTCPAQTNGLTCSQCRLCIRPQRKAIVRFMPHGSGKAKATAAVNNAMQQENRS